MGVSLGVITIIGGFLSAIGVGIWAGVKHDVFHGYNDYGNGMGGGYNNFTGGYNNFTGGYNNFTSGYNNFTSGYNNFTGGYHNPNTKRFASSMDALGDPALDSLRGK